MSNIKKQANSVAKSTQRVIRNSESFGQAISLLIVAAFSYSQLHNHTFHVAVQWVVTIALVVIGVRGAVELIKFLDKD